MLQRESVRDKRRNWSANRVHPVRLSATAPGYLTPVKYAFRAACRLPFSLFAAQQRRGIHALRAHIEIQVRHMPAHAAQPFGESLNAAESSCFFAPFLNFCLTSS